MAHQEARQNPARNPVDQDINFKTQSKKLPPQKTTAMEFHQWVRVKS